MTRSAVDVQRRRVLSAYGIKGVMEFASWIAVMFVAYDRGGPALVGVAGVSMMVPAILLVPLVAGYGDRIPRSRALAATYLIVAVGTAAMALLVLAGAPLAAVLAAGALQTTAISLVQPMHYALLRQLAVRPGDLVAANSVSSALEGVGCFLGAVAAGVLSQGISTGATLAVSAVLAVVSSLLVTGLRPPAEARRTLGIDYGQVREAIAGFSALRGNWAALALLGLLMAAFVIDGSNEVLIITYAAEVLGQGQSAAGLLMGSYGAGMALAGSLQVARVRRRALAPAILAGCLVLGGAWATVALPRTLAGSMLLVVVAGAGASLILVSARTMLQRTTDLTVLARVLAIAEAAQMGGLAAGALLAPLAIAALGPELAFLPLGALVLVPAAVAYPLLRRLDRVAAREREAALLGKVPFLAALPPDDLEHLARTSEWTTASAGSPVVVQGEPGDAYYVVADGQLAVTVDGRPREGLLGPGDGFGEIALLGRTQRSATVRGVTDCTLLMIGSEQFLAAVDRTPEASRMAARLVTDRLRDDEDRRGGGVSER